MNPHGLAPDKKPKMTGWSIASEECRINKDLNKVLTRQNERFEDIFKRIEKIEAILNGNPLDLNNDGIVDKKDASIAGKVLADRKKRK